MRRHSVELSAHTPNPSTTTEPRKTVISRPGDSRCSSPPSYARHVVRFAKPPKGQELRAAWRRSQGKMETFKMKEEADNPVDEQHAQISRRQGLKLGAASIMASLRPVSARPATQNESAPKEKTMADNAAIRPFHFEAPQADLIDLRKRISATKWPDREQVTDASQGVQLATMQKLAQYWASEHDWRKCEAKINAVPNFITEIDGLDIHFIHVRSKHENALPMIVTHGWPGSIIEQMKIIDPLTDPTAHGGTAADAFHLVIPSLPGYGFSGKTTAPGWNPVSIAKAWATLMQRLGYTKYVAQGGDWGNGVSEVMALQQPPGLLGIHTNMAATVPPDVSKAL